jgi:TolB protein
MTPTAQRCSVIASLIAMLLGVSAVALWAPATRAQQTSSEGQTFKGRIEKKAGKANIGVPDFTVVGGASALGRQLAEIAARDLTFSGDFAVVQSTVLSGGPAIPAANPTALTTALAEYTAAGAHIVLVGLLSVREPRAELDIRIYDLATPEAPIATRKFEMATGEIRRLAHKAADEVVFQYTGERGVSDTKLAYVVGRPGAKEIYTADYDGIGAVARTNNGSINLSPAWSPDLRSLAFTSYKGGYPDLYRLFVFERRPEQALVAFNGINTSPAWSPDGRSIALTVSKDGNPEIYVFNVTTGTARRLTRHPGIDTEPSWSPDGREIAFTSDRNGAPHIFRMDAEGTNVRALTTAGFHTQPRWSPRGDLIAYTARHGGGMHEIYVVAVDGTSVRQLTAGGNNESSSWAPNGRHLAFQSARMGPWQIFTMQNDGVDQQPVTRGAGDATSPAWSPRLP